MIMACGTGKTFTGLKIAEDIAGAGKMVLFLVPSLALMSQTIREWTIDAATPLRAFAVCSDVQVGKRRKSTSDVAEIETHDLDYPATTNAAKLADKVAHSASDRMTVVFSTYQSIQVISDAQHKHGLPDFDFIICDEAHRTTGATLDGKVSLDANAFFRHPEHEALEDKAETDPLEAAAKEKDLNYVKLDGSVGIIGNGAGLVMSTLDVVAYAGEEFGGQKPANFLDIGGGASAQVMADGLHIILSDPQVKSVFVNVFGGITACDAVANGIVGALDALGDEEDRPLVVRLDGNNVEEGRRILAERNHPRVIIEATMDGAARRAAELASQA